MKKKPLPTPLRSLLTGLFILAVLVIYAYGFQVTKVNLEETKSETRQTQGQRIIRALFQPDLITYDKEEFNVSAPIMIPCPPQGYTAPAPDTSGPYLIVTPACADPNTEITVEGFNLEAQTTGPLNFFPVPDIPLQLSTVTADANGHFVVTAKLPRQRTSDVPMEIRVTTRRNIGLPRFTRTAMDTWDKIIETIFLALLATTFGTILAAPVSFMAARNLMKDIRTPISGVALALLLIPLGLWLGSGLASQIGVWSAQLTTNPWLNLITLAIAPALAVLLARWALPQEETAAPALSLRLIRFAALLGAVLLVVLSLFLLSSFLMWGGEALAPLLGSFGFLGKFILNLGEILGMFVTLLTALAVAAFFSSLAGQLGLWLNAHLPMLTNRVVTLLLSASAGAVLFFLFDAAITWLYQSEAPAQIHPFPLLTGPILGALLALFRKPNDSIATGIIIYTITRTILNALRSIESLVMVIVFVVWVGIGPFAGVLALALHTIASNAKLYSEQVESISAGPLEALKATGATRLQTIIYAVIPQIIPPFISLTMYRWDINVRMSTIIGFAGGGGIGFLLQQNMNLLNYRSASVQMLAIAVVVSAMDYLSSTLREKVV